MGGSVAPIRASQNRIAGAFFDGEKNKIRPLTFGKRCVLVLPEHELKTRCSTIMALRIDTAVIRGEINNELRGQVTGKIWLAGREDPVVLKLTGNGHRDFAGCHLSFKNSNVVEQPNVASLQTLQTGVVGDMTASRKVKVPTVTEEELYELLRKKEAIPTVLTNSIYIEWFSESNGRVVIESSEFKVRISESQWTLTKGEEKAQLEENSDQMHKFIDSIAQRLNFDEEEGSLLDERPLDEFEWEERLKESDRITDAYMEALDKYRDHPDQEQMVAEAMGWDQSMDSMDEDGHDPLSEDIWGVDDDFEEGEIDAADDGEDEDEEMEEWEKEQMMEDEDDENFFSFEEDDDMEDVDWDNRHPLYERMHSFTMRLTREAQERGLMSDDEGSPTPIQNLVFAAMDLGAKLAGALNGLSRGIEPEPGLVIAWLKRGLPILDRALSACEQAVIEKRAAPDWIDAAKTELFDIRVAMLNLIQEFRNQLP